MSIEEDNKALARRYFDLLNKNDLPTTLLARNPMATAYSWGVRSLGSGSRLS
jgi:hypothetical protein